MSRVRETAFFEKHRYVLKTLCTIICNCLVWMEALSEKIDHNAQNKNARTRPMGSLNGFAQTLNLREIGSIV